MSISLVCLIVQLVWVRMAPNDTESGRLGTGRNTSRQRETKFRTIIVGCRRPVVVSLFYRARFGKIDAMYSALLKCGAERVPSESSALRVQR